MLSKPLAIETTTPLFLCYSVPYNYLNYLMQDNPFYVLFIDRKSSIDIIRISRV